MTELQTRGSVENAVERAKAAYAAGNPVAAKQTFVELCQAHPEVFEFHTALATLAGELDDTPTTIESLERATDIRPGNGAGYYDLALLARNGNQFQTAIRCFEKFLRYFPDKARVCYRMGACHQALGNTQRAIECFRRAVQIAPYYLLAGGRLRNIASAASYAPSLVLRPAEEYLADGHALLGERQIDAAILHFLLAMVIKPKLTAASEALTAALLSLGANAVKVGFIPYFALGHLALNTDLFLRQRTLGKTEPRTHYILLSGEAPANRQLLEMFKRCLNIVESDWLYYVLSEVLPSQVKHGMRISTNEYAEYNSTRTRLTFTAAEEARGQAGLRDLGLDPGRDWFACVFARDAAYTKTMIELFEVDGRRFRNADINSYERAIRQIIEAGGHVFRMGSKPGVELKFRHDRLIDYGAHHRTDFLDVYLLAHCRFVMGTNSGVCDTAMIFDVPYLGVNTAPLGWAPYGRDNLFIPKLLRDVRHGGYVSLPRYIAETHRSKHFLGLWSDRGLDAAGYAYEDNRPEDILDAVKEMLARLEGRYQPLPEDTARQAHYRATFPESHGTHAVPTPIGATFLQKYSEILL